MYTYHFFVCMNKRPDGHERGCCASKGSEKIQRYLKARVKELGLKNIRINKAGCMDMCEKGPVSVCYPENVWYNVRTIEEAENLIQSHFVKGASLEPLRMK